MAAVSQVPGSGSMRSMTERNVSSSAAIRFRSYAAPYALRSKMNAADPKAEYQRRLARRRESVQRLTARCERLSSLRLAVFAVAGFIFFAALKDWCSAHFLWLPVAAFAWLVILHGRATLEEIAAERAVGMYERGIARIEDRWMGHGSTGSALRPAHHLYADDLDLFGDASLFQLLCRARTHAGERRLGEWLLEPAPIDTVRERQVAVEELRSRLDLREDLAVVAGEVSGALDRSLAATWGRSPPVLDGYGVPLTARVLGLLSAGLLVTWLVAGAPYLTSPILLPMFACWIAQAIFCIPIRKRADQVLEDAQRPAKDLALIARLLERIEQERFESPLLVELQRCLETEGDAPSARIHRLNRTMGFVESRENQVFLPISWLLALGVQFAYRIEHWRARNGTHLEQWIDALASFEALCSLSGYAYEHPDDVMPELVDGGAVFDGADLGHPLLPAATCVRNSVALGGVVSHGLLVSGSNMSGKSTLLRTVGINAVLALAGAPVRATSLRISQLAVGASIRVMDSLQEGASRFYAEIERLRAIVGMAQNHRVLFLLDEILHGTNSHDRRIGAEAVVRTLLERDALGLVTTHDLALAEIAKRDERMDNVHFADEIIDGRIVFDYRMQPGVVERSNALELMRSVGLDV